MLNDESASESCYRASRTPRTEKDNQDEEKEEATIQFYMDSDAR